MLHLPVLRWGNPYTSMEVDDVVHFSTGEPIARVSRANGGLVQRDMRKAAQAREALRAIPIDELIARVTVEERGVPVSYQAQSPVLGLVLPSNSPGVHTLRMPINPLQIGRALK